MKRTTCKAVKDAIRQEVIDLTWDAMIEDEAVVPENGYSFTFAECAEYIDHTFTEEFYRWHQSMNRQDAFVEWCMGIPSCLSFVCSWKCKDFLQRVLEETDAEAERFSETDAEQMLAKLIYREVVGQLSKSHRG